MANLKIIKHHWQPNFANEICITDKKKECQFCITLKQKEEIEIEFDWDYNSGGRGSERMFISIKLLKELIEEIEK